MTADCSAVDAAIYPQAKLHGVSNGIHSEYGVRLSFDIEDGSVLRIRMSPEQFRRFAKVADLVTLGLRQDEFVAGMEAIHATQYSQSSESEEAPSIAGLPQDGQSV